ncbi:MAG: hypothetical protein JNK12_06460 [Acidimicrobiales bacterium]|nr:hypothetical protein [Acidimicrobiales bacterium]
MRKFLGLMLVGLLFAGTAAACSSDDDGGDSGDTTETTAADSGDSGDASSNPDVEEFCTQAEDLGEQLQAAVDDPTSADAAEITQQASELSAAAAELTSANPDDVDRINECAALLSVTP